MNTSKPSKSNPLMVCFDASQTRDKSFDVLKRLVGSPHEIVIHDMQQSDGASKPKQYGVRSASMRRAPR